MIGFIGSATAAGTGTSITVDVSGIPIQRGDLAIAQVVYADEIQIPSALPSGWTRITPETLFRGECLAQFLAADVDELVFESATAGDTAVLVAIYRGVAGVSALALAFETPTTGSTSHTTDAFKSPVAGTVVHAHFFWFSVGGAIGADGATTKRAESITTGAAAMLADEVVGIANNPSRKATTVAAGDSIAVTMLFEPGDNTRTSFDRFHGELQGRILVDGVIVYELGHAERLHFEPVSVGYRHTVYQAIKPPGNIIRVRVHVRPPNEPPPSLFPIAWQVALLVDGVDIVVRDIDREQDIEIGANLAGVPGAFELGVELRLA